MSDIRFNQGTTGTLLLKSSRASDTGRAGLSDHLMPRAHTAERGEDGCKGGREGRNKEGREREKGKGRNEMLPAVQMSAWHLGLFHTCSI